MNITLREPKIGALQIKQMIVAVDLSPNSEKTAAYASSIAKSFGASMTLVHVYPPDPIIEVNMEQIDDRFSKERTEMKQKLEHLSAKIRETYPKCRAEFCTGKAAEDVSLLAEKLSADLIVTASHNRSFIGQLFNLEQAPKIVHRAPCPVLVYQNAPAKPVLDIRQIVAPTDRSAESLKALNYALGLAQHFGSRLTLLRVYDEAVPDADETMHVQARKYIDNSLLSFWENARARQVACETIFEWGRANELIPAVAEKFDADLLVLSTHDFRWLHHLFFGSDAERILRHAPCPVLIFREKR
jgi:nucleotide-binding universal stress UspA family protein